MAKFDLQKKEYRSLPGRHKNFAGGLITLWQGQDHLLSVVYTFGTERYKRFYYQDIQAVILRKTAMGKIQNVILAVLAAAFGLPAFSMGEIAAGIFGAVSAAFIMILLINVWRGPTCQCLIQTAVQKEELKNLYRFKTAVKALARIVPLVQNVQGRLAAADLEAAWRSTPTAERNIGKPAIPDIAASPSRKLHLVLFGTLLALGLVAGLVFFRQSAVLVLIEMVFGLTAAVLAIPAIVHQQQSEPNRAVRVITWISVGYTAACLLGGYVIYMFIAFKHPMILYDQLQVLKLAAALSPHDHPLLFGINLFVSLGALILGSAGLVTVRRSC